MVIENELVYLWEMFHVIAQGMNRYADGHALHMTLGQILEWQGSNKIELSPFEISVIKAMDMIFVQEMNAEIELYKERVKARGNKS